MIINAMTTAHRNEYFRKLREHQRLTLESVTEQRDEVRADLEFRRGLFQLQEQQMDSLREQRDRLAEALREIDEARLDDFMGPHDMALKCVLIAREALAAVKGGKDD
jgi:hypothetical protein